MPPSDPASAASPVKKDASLTVPRLFEFDWKGSHALAIAALTVLVVAAFGLMEPRFLAPGNLLDTLRQTAVIAMLAFAMTAVIITRGIDLSVGGTLAFSGIALGAVYESSGSWLLAGLTALGTGAAIGLINGIIVGVLGVSAFLATFAMLIASRAAALVASGASSVIIADPLFIWLGQGNVLGVPSSVVILLVMLAAWSFLLQRTRFGRYLFAVGNSPAAAVASLLPVPRIVASVYVLSGLSAGFCAILTVGRLGSAQPLAGSGVEFAALTAAVIGGASLSGGKGSMAGTFLGALLLGALSTGLSFLQISQQMTYVVTGLLIVASVLITDAEFRARARKVFSIRRMAKVETDVQRLRDRIADVGTQAVQLDGISKSYGGVQALRDVGFTIRRGEVVALLGENGAGKSTLVKCLSGSVKPDSGVIIVGDESFELAALTGGVDCSTVHQHFSLAPDLSLVDNLVAINRKAAWAPRQRAKIRARIEDIHREFQLQVNSEDPIGTLSVGQRQIAEIVKGLVEGKWLIILDEPTSALSVRERDSLFRVIAQLRQKNVAVIYISHKMEEIFEVAQRIVVLRDGSFVGEVATRDATESQLIQMMVGRQIEAVFPYFKATASTAALEVRDLSDGTLVHDASLTVNHGEIVGIAGLMGSGRSELLRCIAGLTVRTSGTVHVEGRSVPAGGPLAARELGLAYVPEDRLTEGIFPDMSVFDNLTLCWLSLKGSVPQRSAKWQEGRRWVERLDIRPARPAMRVGSLSGGNQQKVVLGKYLAMRPKVLLLDEPTQGVDVGAKSEIHGLIGELKKQGMATLMISSELPELLSVADRVVVMAKGRTSAPLPHGISQEQVMGLALQTARPQAHGAAGAC